MARDGGKEAMLGAAGADRGIEMEYGMLGHVEVFRISVPYLTAKQE